MVQAKQVLSVTSHLTARPTATGEKQRASVNHLPRPRVGADVRSSNPPHLKGERDEKESPVSAHDSSSAGMYDRGHGAAGRRPTGRGPRARGPTSGRPVSP